MGGLGFRVYIEVDVQCPRRGAFSGLGILGSRGAMVEGRL